MALLYIINNKEMKKKNIILSAYSFPKIYNRGEIDTINGVEVKYIKMIEGQLHFSSIDGKERYRLTKKLEFIKL